MAEFQFLIGVNTGTYQGVLQPPHITSSEVLIFKRQLQRVQRHQIRVDNIHADPNEYLHLKYADNRLLHADRVCRSQQSTSENLAGPQFKLTFSLHFIFQRMDLK